MSTIQENQEAIEAILDHQEHLTEWEQLFIESVSEQLTVECRNLSEKQESVLDRIFRKVVA